MLPDFLLRLFFRRRWRGFETLLRLSGSKHITVRNRYGALFALDPHDYVDSVVLREGFYESEVFEALQNAFEPNAVFWDIGSCFGLHAITAATLFPDLRVYAFEPNPRSQERIQQNAALNRVSIELCPLGLDNRDGTGELYLPAAGNSGMATLRPSSQAVFSRGERVAIARAASLITSGGVAAPTVIKLDVEGGEEAVLRGFDDHLLSPNLRLIVLECSPRVLGSDGGDPVRELLTNAGFELRPLVRNEETSHPLINIVAFRAN